MQALVVDDSRVMREVARQILEKMSFSVGEAVDTDSALVSCQRQLPDLVLIDLNMPGANVGIFIRALRRLPEGEATRVLLIALENDLGLLSEAFQAGADDYVLKPFDYGTISAKVKELLPDNGD